MEIIYACAEYDGTLFLQSLKEIKHEHKATAQLLHMLPIAFSRMSYLYLIPIREPFRSCNLVWCGDSIRESLPMNIRQK